MRVYFFLILMGTFLVGELNDQISILQGYYNYSLGNRLGKVMLRNQVGKT